MNVATRAEHSSLNSMAAPDGELLHRAIALRRRIERCVVLRLQP
jgi:hypothetical protein